VEEDEINKIALLNTLPRLREWNTQREGTVLQLPRGHHTQLLFAFRPKC
jgi:hypothetical protein